MMDLQEIIKTAMLGTEKYAPQMQSPLLREVQAKVVAGQEDGEDAFLKLISAYCLLNEAGKKLSENPFQHPAPPPETKSIISAEANTLLKQLIRSKEEALMDYFIDACLKNEKIAGPELVPALLDLALEKKNRKADLLHMCGERGAWLGNLREDWQALFVQSEERVWETGSLPQRKEFLQKLRHQQPDEALALLQKSIGEENAATRNEFLEVLAINLSARDEAFLESQLKDKSGKVKQTAYTLLKMIPESTLSRQYRAFIKEAIRVKEERVLLLAKKKVIEINREVGLGESLAQSGIDKVSSQKGVADVDYWVAQVMEYIHPDFWQEAYGLSVDQLVPLFVFHPQKSLWIPALVNSAFLFRHKALANALLQHADAPNPQLLQLLDLQERFAFAEDLVETNPAATLPLLLNDTYTLMPEKLCRKFLQKFKKEPYAIQQPQYLKWALYMPVTLLEELQKLASSEAAEYQQRYLKNVATEMGRMIETREQINSSL